MQQYQTNAWELPCHLFHQGKNFKAYQFFGAHPCLKDQVPGVCFRVWAPRAQAVSIVGDFNGWQPGTAPMERLQDSSVWEGFIPGMPQYALYKYAIQDDKGNVRLKADPYAFYSETRQGTASKVYDIDAEYEWQDAHYMEWRKKQNPYASPMNIYEVHLGSWKQKEDGTEYNYREYADQLIPYAKSMGYTHLELLPLMEHPFDGSWGYQVCGYYSVTARYGTPEDFRYFVDKAHQNGLGVILDWVPAHFPKDAHGLMEFDGHPLYEDENPARREHIVWGTRIFDFGRPEVISFLISNAMFWLDKYHLDGLRVDAVAAMLYLDFDRPPGQWEPNQYGGRGNLEAEAFLKKMNEAVLTEFPYALTIAEESTEWPMITKPPKVGGLGFNFKWDMGWMNDTLKYMETDPFFRKNDHQKLTFPMMYAFNENYILPISHDEVVHGKRSLLDKMPGSYENKFANDRAFTTFMMTRPGKKLSFMGNEFAQFKEWAYKEGLEFFMLDYEMHRKFHAFSREINLLYLEKQPLWENDQDWDGFQWVVADDAPSNCCAYRRIAKNGHELLIAINFSPVLRQGYTLPLQKADKYQCIFNSDAEEFGGGGVLPGDILPVKQADGQYYATVTLPPLGAVIWEIEAKKTQTQKNQTV
ncbi:MAG: 1,4-alpha-glucan branching protein GlgB [Clostridia bacterium]|nr:1,4-alpha-glucan branching protein GlgB [Clostridia bacterium]